MNAVLEPKTQSAHVADMGAKLAFSKKLQAVTNRIHSTANVDEMAKRYINTTPYPLRDPKGEERVLFKVRPTYVMTFGPPPPS